jgi:hypothetical protein
MIRGRASTISVGDAVVAHGERATAFMDVGDDNYQVPGL